MKYHCRHLHREHARVWPCDQPAIEVHFFDGIGYGWCVRHAEEGRADAARRTPELPAVAPWRAAVTELRDAAVAIRPLSAGGFDTHLRHSEAEGRLYRLLNTEAD